MTDEKIPENKVVTFDGKPLIVGESKSDNADVVELLELTLAKAKAGLIVSACVIYTVPEPDGEFRFVSDWKGPRITLLGAMSRAQYALNKLFDQSDTGKVGEDV